MVPMTGGLASRGGGGILQGGGGGGGQSKNAILQESQGCRMVMTLDGENGIREKMEAEWENVGNHPSMLGALNKWSTEKTHSTLHIWFCLRQYK